MSSQTTVNEFGKRNSEITHSVANFTQIESINDRSSISSYCRFHRLAIVLDHFGVAIQITGLL